MIFFHICENIKTIAKKENMNAIKTAIRVCEIFELFEEARRPLRLKDFMEKFQYPPSSASGLLKSLVELGYLEYDLTTRCYLPTMRMPMISSWIERARFGNGNVLAAMQRLHEVTEETISLGLQSDLHAQYVYQIRTKLPLPYPATRQTIRPLAGSGLGWLLLSAMPDETVSHLIKRINYGVKNSSKKVNLRSVFLKINEVRRSGYVFSKHTVVKDAGMIGMLIPNPKNGRQLALCVHGPVVRLEQKESLILKELSSVCNAAMALDLETTSYLKN